MLLDSLAGGLVAANGGLDDSLAGLGDSGGLLGEDNNAALLVGENTDSLFIPMS